MEARYKGEVQITFQGDGPVEFNGAAPEIGAAWDAAVDALQESLRASGYQIVRTGYGSYRLGGAEQELWLLERGWRCGNDNLWRHDGIGGAYRLENAVKVQARA